MFVDAQENLRPMDEWRPATVEEGKKIVRNQDELPLCAQRLD